MKLKLDNGSVTTSFFEDSALLGIMAPVKDYLFTWNVNQRLGFNFRINNDLEIPLLKKNRQYFFPVYEFMEKDSDNFHLIYNNQHDGEYLLPEFKHLDFLWFIKDSTLQTSKVQMLIQAIRQLPSVQMVLELTNEKIKHKDHLIV